MKSKLFSLLLAVAVLPAISQAPMPDKPIEGDPTFDGDAEEVGPGLITGRVEQVVSSERRIRLYLGGTYPNHRAAVFVYPDAFGAFPFATRYQNARITVFGKIGEHHGRPAMILRSHSQMRSIKY
jgi:hypothetical protein